MRVQASADPAVRASIPIRDRLLELAFRLYKSLLSPIVHALAPSRCIYLPTCSEYAYTAVSRYGLLRGSRLALRRVMRCHPWGKGGFDPVPGVASSTPAPNSSTLAGSGQNSADHLP